MESFFSKFRLNNEQERYEIVVENIDRSVLFRGTNLWILILAIFIASLGLNVNSPAVIIGAMLISPLMGPIMGIGLSMGINDLSLWRKSLYNYLVATAVALFTSTLFFTISPLSDAHSEILARTAPNVYDVLIAFIGGLAGILANSSTLKGNVIPGVAIATALMPPLCTAGYGLATLQLPFFLGAFYLYFINSVFIALATLLFTRFLKFPQKQMETSGLSKRVHRIMWVIVIATLLPSIYFAWDLIQRDRFTKNANRFIQSETHFENDYLLSKKIDAEEKNIILVFGGKGLSSEEINTLKQKLVKYKLADASLEVEQGFAYFREQLKNDENNYELLSNAIDEREKQNKMIEATLDSIEQQKTLQLQVQKELMVQYPNISSAIITRANESKAGADSVASAMIVVIKSDGKLSTEQRSRIQDWLAIRLKLDRVNLIVQ